MKKSALTFILLALTAMYCSADGPVPKGKSQFNAGVGQSTWGIPLYVGIDYGIHKDITLGAEVSQRTYRDIYFGTKYRHSITGICVNGNYHFNTLMNLPKQWNVYAGVNVGFFFWASSNNYPGTSSTGLGMSGQVGGRYYFNDKFGINAEVGGGNAFSGGKFGISLKL